MSSTDFRYIELDAIANFEYEIKIGERKYSRKNTVYQKPVSFTITGDTWRKLYALMQHVEGDCDSNACKFCKNSED